MPKPNDLNLLKPVKIEPAPAASGVQPVRINPNYFLFMLGTDTRYTHRPTKNPASDKPTDYDNGETLSYMAQVVVDRLKETATIEEIQDVSKIAAAKTATKTTAKTATKSVAKVAFKGSFKNGCRFRTGFR